jgi:hypothetical protein
LSVGDDYTRSNSKRKAWQRAGKVIEGSSVHGKLAAFSRPLYFAADFAVGDSAALVVEFAPASDA